MIFDFLQVFSKIRQLQHFYADDAIDKLNRSSTVIFLIVAGLIILARAVFGPAIICTENSMKN